MAVPVRRLVRCLRRGGAGAFDFEVRQDELDCWTLGGVRKEEDGRGEGGNFDFGGKGAVRGASRYE